MNDESETFNQLYQKVCLSFHQVNQSPVPAQQDAIRTPSSAGGPGTGCFLTQILQEKYKNSSHLQSKNPLSLLKLKKFLKRFGIWLPLLPFLENVQTQTEKARKSSSKGFDSDPPAPPSAKI